MGPGVGKALSNQSSHKCYSPSPVSLCPVLLAGSCRAGGGCEQPQPLLQRALRYCQPRRHPLVLVAFPQRGEAWKSCQPCSQLAPAPPAVTQAHVPGWDAAGPSPPSKISPDSTLWTACVKSRSSHQGNKFGQSQLSPLAETWPHETSLLI